MQVLSAGANVVVVARQFNPSIFSELWLTRHAIVGEEQRLPGCLFSDDVAKVEVSNFGLLVLPPQLQFVPRTTHEDEESLVVSKVGGIVKLLPETPFIALGLNFQWQVWSDTTPTKTVARRMFFKSDNPLFCHFDSDDATFGTYASRDVFGLRMKLNVTPVDVFTSKGDAQTADDTIQRLLFAFNFHLELPKSDNLPDLIEQHLRKWNQARDLAFEIVQDTTKHES